MARDAAARKTRGLRRRNRELRVRGMCQPKILTLYLEDDLRESVAAGRHNFLGKIVGVAEAAKFRIALRPNSDVERAAAGDRPGYGLTHMTRPVNDRCLVLRRVYHYPFWQIDRSDKRWEWVVAKKRFDATSVDQKEATRFFKFWRKRLFGNMLGEVADDGFVYIPLQGRLLERRSFQRLSPMDMIRRTLTAMPQRDIIATLHPKENYSDSEIAKLEELSKEETRLKIKIGEMDRLLPRCHCVVTQNSSVAFDGIFLEKPYVLFGAIDFHHIGLSTFDGLALHKPDYAAYVWWFWQQESINAGHGSAEEKIAARLRAAGWPI